MNKTIIIIAVIAVLGIGGVVGYQMMNSSKTNSQAESNMSPTPEMTPTSDAQQMPTTTVASGEAQAAKMITLDEIKNHSKAEDCWLAIEGKVYDATPYIQKQIHPGGAALLFGCGKDATAIFNLRPKDNKPHSDKARSYLPEYYIGELAK